MEIVGKSLDFHSIIEMRQKTCNKVVSIEIKLKEKPEETVYNSAQTHTEDPYPNTHRSRAVGHDSPSTGSNPLNRKNNMM